MKITVVTIATLSAVLLLGACDEQKKNSQTVRIIFDTDMGPDYDDVGASALLHAFADNGEAEILATMASTKHESVAAVLNVINTYFKRPELPIGVPKGDARTLRDFQHWTDTLVKRYPHKIRSNAEAPDAVSLYREILAGEEDGAVTIVTVGFLTNIANLLKSTQDEHSPLSGKELVRRKVKNLVCMAGKFPEGKEFNIAEDALAAKYVFENFESPILFSGFEIGAEIKTGLPLVRNDSIRNSPVKDVFAMSIPMAAEDSAGRMSWDETAVLVAVRGVEPLYKLQAGTIEVDSTGFNRWNNTGEKHHYLIANRPVSEVQELINELMMHQPSE